MNAFVPPTCNTASHEKVKEESVRRQLLDEKELYCFSELRFYAYASQTSNLERNTGCEITENI